MATIKFTISFGLLAMPVRLEPAARETRVRFNRVSKDGNGVAQRLFDKETGVEVAKGELSKGFEHNGAMVTVDTAAIAAAKPISDKKVKIEEFVPAETVDPIFFNASYYVSPEEAGEEAYTILYSAMKETGKYAIAKATMYGRETPIVLRVHGKGLTLHRLFYEDEVRTLRTFRVDESAVDARKLKIAKSMLGMMTEKAFNPAKYKDAQAEALNALRLGAAGVSAPQVDLTEQLEKSLALIRNRVENAPAPPAEKVKVQRAKRKTVASAPAPTLIDEIIKAEESKHAAA